MQDSIWILFSSSNNKRSRVKCLILNYHVLDEVERDIENYRGKSWRYLPKPQFEANSANKGLNNSRYSAKTEWTIPLLN